VERLSRPSEGSPWLVLLLGDARLYFASLLYSFDSCSYSFSSVDIPGKLLFGLQ
jgi:hypothetical protein